MSDFVNGLFELIGAAFIAMSIRRLIIDKQVRGLSLWHPMFFLLWGAWNLWFYPAVGCWYSFTGGVAVFITNAIWMGLMLYYSRKE